MMSVTQAFDLAIQHHQAGRLAEAETLYRQVLAAEPQHGEAWHHLGILAAQTAQHSRAVECITQALRLGVQSGAAYANLGEAYRLGGRLDEALAAFQEALRLDPKAARAHFGLTVGAFNL